MARPLLVALALAVTTQAHAQGTTPDCHPPPMAPLTVSPSSGAPNASLNAPVIVRYGPNYFDPILGTGQAPSTLFRLVECGTHCGSVCDVTTGTEVPGLVQTQGDDLIFVPDQEFAPGTMYAGRATGVDGDLPFNFCTGSSRDVAAPQAVAISSVSSMHVTGLTCLDDGYRIGVTCPVAMDDGPAGSVEYLLFQTRGQGIDMPTLVDRFRPSSNRITLAFLLPADAARTPICLQVVTVDGAGHATVPNGERCFDPIGRTTFVGCGVGSGGGGGSVLAVVLGVLVIARRRRGA